MLSQRTVIQSNLDIPAALPHEFRMVSLSCRISPALRPECAMVSTGSLLHAFPKAYLACFREVLSFSTSFLGIWRMKRALPVPNAADFELNTYARRPTVSVLLVTRNLLVSPDNAPHGRHPVIPCLYATTPN